MSIIKLQNILLGVKQISKTPINKSNFNALSCMLAHTVSNDYDTSCCTNVQNAVTKQYDAKIQNSLLFSCRSRILSNTTLYSKKNYVGCKIHHAGQSYNSIRYLSTIDTIVETKTTSGIFKIISESTPVKITQDSLLWMHDYTGLPWWSIIVLTTIMMRATITVPLALYQHYIFAKVENLKYEMEELIKEMKKELSYGASKYNWSKKYAKRLYIYSVKKQWNKLIVRENCHPFKGALLVVVQIPLWISLSMSIRNLCYMLPKQDVSAYATYQELTTDGFLWLTNLTIADPIVLPITMGLLNLAIIEISLMTRMNKSTKLGQYLTYFLRICAVGMIPIAMYVPSCVSLYWVTSSAFGLFQNLALLSPRLRRFARIPVTESESPHPYSLLRDKLLAKYSFKKKVEIPS